MATTAALGFKIHTGWAVVVAISSRSQKFQLHLRRRIELLPPDKSIPRFVYHEAAERSLAQATELVARAKKAAASAAQVAVREVLRELRSRNVRVHAGGVLGGTKSVPEELSEILGSHTRIHTAEGVLFEHAVVLACENSRLAAILAREQEVWARAALAWRIEESALHEEVVSWRKALGAPWGADHKAATAAALLALKSKATL